MIQAFAERVGHPFAHVYRPDLDIEVYRSLQDLAQTTREKIAILAPPDTIHVQSFMWTAVEYDDAGMPGDGPIEKRDICIAPWSITIATPKTTAIVHSYADVGFEGHTADRLVKNLRYAVAHGARKIHPLHSPGKSPHRKLTGFQFDCEERNGSKVKWNGRIRLTAPDMRRIGIEIAHRFCKELQKSSGYSYLGEDLAEGVSEAA